MKKFWNWIHDDSGGRVLRLEGPIDSESFWGDEITPAMFREELEAEEGDVTVWINSPGGNVRDRHDPRQRGRGRDGGRGDRAQDRDELGAGP